MHVWLCISRRSKGYVIPSLTTDYGQRSDAVSNSFRHKLYSCIDAHIYTHLHTRIKNEVIRENVRIFSQEKTNAHGFEQETTNDHDRTPFTTFRRLFQNVFVLPLAKCFTNPRSQRVNLPFPKAALHVCDSVSFPATCAATQLSLRGGAPEFPGTIKYSGKLGGESTVQETTRVSTEGARGGSFMCYYGFTLFVIPFVRLLLAFRFVC